MAATMRLLCLATVFLAVLGSSFAEDYVLILPDEESTLEGEPWEATILSNAPSSFEVQRAYADSNVWTTFGTVDRKVTVSSDDNKATIFIREATSRWFVYKFRVLLFPHDEGPRVTTEEFRVSIVPTNQVVFQPPQRNVAEGKRFSVFWQPPGTDYPEFTRIIVRTRGAASGGGTTGYILDMTTSDGGTASLKLTSSVTVNSYWEQISDYCALTFSQSPTTSAEAQTAKTNVAKVVVQAVRDSYPNQDYTFVLASDVQPVRSADKNKEYTIQFYVRSLTTGAPVDNGRVRFALGLAANDQKNANFASEFITRAGSALALDRLTLTLASVNLALVNSFALHKFSTLRSSTNFFIRAQSATELEVKISEFAADENMRWYPVVAGVDGAPVQPFSASQVQWQSVKFPASFISYTITGFTGVGNTEVNVAFTLSAVGSIFTIATQGAFYLTDSGINGDSAYVWAAQRCAEYTSESLLVQNVQACQASTNNPTYRRMEIDLNGFFGVTTVSVQMPNYPFPSDVSLAGALPSGASNSSKSRLELWGSIDGKVYVDLTESVNGARTTCSGGEPAKAGSLCTVAFAVQDFTRSNLVKPGNFGWRYFRIVFGSMERQSDRLLTSDRFFAASEIKFTGYCLCNGHSNKCDYSTGKCYEVDSVTKQVDDLFRCQHKTIGEQCQECEPNTYRNPTNDPPINAYNCDPADPDGRCDGPAITEITPVEIESMQYRYGSQRGNPIVTVDSSTVRFQYALAFQVFFSVTGPCVDCFCYGHSVFDDRPIKEVRDIAGCDGLTASCYCSDASNTINGAWNKCELCKQGFCRTCNATSDDLCRFEDCEACDCNLHATTRLPNGKDLCAADGCGCSCIPGDNVEGDHCENCKKGYWSSTGNGKVGMTCTKCSCNGHKPLAVVGTDKECAVLGGN
eukprot:Opistho-2@68094